MTQNMKELLATLANDRFTVNDCENILKALANFARAKRHLKESQTPEGDSLARWEILDAETDWAHTCLVYGLPHWDARSLIE